MTTRTISLDEVAYERLKACKRDGESFSDVVKRLTRERFWSEVVGILDEEEAEALEATIEEGRSRPYRKSDRLVDELAGNGVTKNQND